MSTYFLASPPAAAPLPPSASREPIPTLTLESLDGSRVIALGRGTGWIRMPGSTGLEMPPVDVVTHTVPGVPGSILSEVRVEERPIFIPIHAASRDAQQVTHLAMMDALRSLIDPVTGMFRLVGTTVRSSRQLTAVYTGGLEGADGRDDAGLYWRKFGLQAIACQPFAQARFDRTVEFAAGAGAGPFLGAAGGTNVPWPRALSSSAVVGDNMLVNVASEVPVYPVIDLVGPMDSFAGTVSLQDGSLPPFFGGQQWSISIPSGVPSGSTFRMVTDPRAKSFRMDGQLAAGRVARGSQLRPFYPGVNVMDVVAPGSDENTRVRISWRELHRSLW